MARVTADEVLDIIDVSSNLVDSATLTIAISTANEMLNAAIAQCPKLALLSATLLMRIEQHLAAHFIATYDRRYEEEEATDTRRKYGGSLTQGLRFTPYGQAVMTMDITQCFKRIDEGETLNQPVIRTLWNPS